MKKLSKTRLDIILYIGITMAVIVFSLSGVLFVFTRKEGISFVSQSHREILNAAGFHMNYVNQVSKSFCLMQFNDSDVQTLLTSPHAPDPILTGQVIHRMERFIQVNEMAESIFLYNGRSGMCFGTRPLVSREMQDISKLIDGNAGDKSFMVIPRVVYNEATGEGDHTVLTYIAAERDPVTHDILSAVCVNVQSSWLADQIAPPDKNNQNGHMLLLNSSSQILLDTAREKADAVSGSFGVDYSLYSKAAENINRSFFWEENGERQVVSAKAIDGTDWILLNSQPYSGILTFVHLMQYRIMLAVLLSFLVGIPLTILISKLIYNPIDNLFQHIRETSAMPNEVSLLVKGDVEDLRYIYDRQNAQVRKSRLKAVLTDSDTQIADSVFSNLSDLYHKGQPAALFLLNIFDEHVYQNDLQEKNLIRFAVCNIAEELFQPLGAAMTIPLSGNKIARLVSFASETDPQLVHKTAEELSEKAAEYLEIELAVFYRLTVCDRDALNASCRSLNSMSRYTLLLGTRAVLSTDELEKREKTVIEYPKEIEKKLLDAINRTSTEQADELLQEFLTAVSQGSIDQYLICILQFSVALQNYVSQMNEHKLSKIHADFSVVQKTAYERETQVHKNLTELIHDIMGQIPYDTRQKNNTIVNSVCRFIDENYADKDICSKFLASKMGISASYLNVLFKEVTGSGVGEYINSVRLTHAQELVLHSDCQIAQIIESCGLETSSFYRLYKARFGVSPKEQRAGQKLGS